MLQIAVCDDRVSDRERICQAVSNTHPEAQVRAFASPSALLEQIGQNWLPAVALLDIQMTVMDGIHLAKELNLPIPPEATAQREAFVMNLISTLVRQ